MNVAERSAIIVDVANRLNVNPAWLDNLIKFESNYKPKAANPYSTAKGLIQFIDSTARDLGFKSSLDLVTKLPGFREQMYGAVLPYLQKYAPFPTKQSLYMAVFYPRARKWPLMSQFPDSVQAVNPGIKTVGDYVRKVEGKKINPWPIMIAAAAFFIIKKVVK